MRTKEDLLNLLNYIKQCEKAEKGKWAIRYLTMQNLEYFSNSNYIGRCRMFFIRKKSGGKRMITAPRMFAYKELLHYTYELLKAMYVPSDYAMGFVEGRSIVDNAKPHVGKNYVFNTDLEDFFPSISAGRVCQKLQQPPFCFTPEVAHILTGLCCIRERRRTAEEDAAFQEAAPFHEELSSHEDASEKASVSERVEEEKGRKKVACFLPQGAPTSPILANIVCEELDRKLAGLAQRFHLTYSRYADDITFSSMHYVYAKQGEFMQELRRIINDFGFGINEKKTRLQKRGGLQEVTGLRVTDRVNVSQAYIRDLRNILYIWQRYGMLVAMQKFVDKHPYTSDSKGCRWWHELKMERVLEGKLLYLKMVRGEDDSVYKRLREQMDKLLARQASATRITFHRVHYLATTPLLAFERGIGEELTLHFGPMENSWRVAFWEEKSFGEEPTWYFGPRQKRWTLFHWGGKVQLVEIRKNITSDVPKEQLAISLCRGKNGIFWLVHKAIRGAD